VAQDLDSRQSSDVEQSLTHDMQLLAVSSSVNCDRRSEIGSAQVTIQSLLVGHGFDTCEGVQGEKDGNKPETHMRSEHLAWQPLSALECESLEMETDSHARCHSADSVQDATDLTGCANSSAEVKEEFWETDDELFCGASANASDRTISEVPQESLQRSSSCPCYPTWIRRQGLGEGQSWQPAPASLVKQLWPFVEETAIAPQFEHAALPAQTQIADQRGTSSVSLPEFDGQTLPEPCTYQEHQLQQVVWMPVLVPYPHSSFNVASVAPTQHGMALHCQLRLSGDVSSGQVSQQ
jgi:hypothetical protein